MRPFSEVYPIGGLRWVRIWWDQCCVCEDPIYLVDFGRYWRHQSGRAVSLQERQHLATPIPVRGRHAEMAQ